MLADDAPNLQEPTLIFYCGSHSTYICPILFLFLCAFIPFAPVLTLPVCICITLGSAAVVTTFTLKSSLRTSLTTLIASLLATIFTLLLEVSRASSTSTLALQSRSLTGIVLTNGFLLLSLLALFASLHFYELQRLAPSVILYSERLVMALLPFASAGPLYGLLLGFFHPRQVPILFALVLAWLYHQFFAKAHKSSFLEAIHTFSEEDESPEEELKEQLILTGHLEAAAFAVFLLTAPASAFIASGGLFARTSNQDGLLQLLGLVSLPGLTLLAPLYVEDSNKNPLWWLPPPATDYLTKTQFDILSVCFCVMGTAAWVAHYFLRYSPLSPYLTNWIEPPWDHALFFVSLLSAFAGAWILLKQQEHQRHRNNTEETNGAQWLTGILLLASSGVGFLLLANAPFFIVCLGALFPPSVALCVTGPGLDNLFVALASSSCILLWWMWHTFAVVIEELSVIRHAATINIYQITGRLLLCYLFGALSLFSTLEDEFLPALPYLLLLHAHQVSWVERVLYSQSDKHTFSVMLVVGISVGGIILMHHLTHHRLLSRRWSHLLSGYYLSTLVTYLMDRHSMEAQIPWHHGWTLLATQLAITASAGLTAELDYWKQVNRNACEEEEDDDRLHQLVKHRQWWLMATLQFLVWCLGLTVFRTSILPVAFLSLNIRVSIILWLTSFMLTAIVSVWLLLRYTQTRRAPLATSLLALSCGSIPFLLLFSFVSSETVSPWALLVWLVGIWTVALLSILAHFSVAIAQFLSQRLREDLMMRTVACMAGGLWLGVGFTLTLFPIRTPLLVQVASLAHVLAVSLACLSLTIHTFYSLLFLSVAVVCILVPALSIVLIPRQSPFVYHLLFSLISLQAATTLGLTTCAQLIKPGDRSSKLVRSIATLLSYLSLLFLTLWMGRGNLVSGLTLAPSVLLLLPYRISYPLAYLCSFLSLLLVIIYQALQSTRRFTRDTHAMWDDTSSTAGSRVVKKMMTIALLFIALIILLPASLSHLLFLFNLQTKWKPQPDGMSPRMFRKTRKWILWLWFALHLTVLLIIRLGSALRWLTGLNLLLLVIRLIWKKPKGQLEFVSAEDVQIV